MCTDIGWPIADLWQNVYLKTAGAADYDALAAHNIAWTGPTVTTAFDTLAQLVGQTSYLLGGTKGSLANDYPECADKVFPKAGSMPQAAMVIEGDFVVSEIVGNSANYSAGTVAAKGKKCTANPEMCIRDRCTRGASMWSAGKTDRLELQPTERSPGPEWSCQERSLERRCGSPD